MTLAGRSAPGGRVDDLTLQSGHWADRPGQMVLAVNPSSDVQIGLPLGARLTVTSAPGHPVLTVVGKATSVTNSADGWVTPGEIARLRTPGTPGSDQMLYRFRSAGTAAAVRADAAAVSAALPSGAVTAVQSYLTVREQETSQIGPFVPFLVAFAGDRPGDVGADRGQRGQRRGGVGLPPDRDPQEHRLHPGAGGGGLYGPGHGARAGRRAGRPGGRRPAGHDAAAPGRERLRRGPAQRAGVGGRGRARGHARPGRDRGPAAGHGGGPAQRGAGHRRGPGPPGGPRLRRAPAAAGGCGCPGR